MRSSILTSLVVGSLIFASCQKDIKDEPKKPDNNNDSSVVEIPVADTVANVAGSGVAGFKDGSLDSAMFHKPKGIAIDAAGNLYVADYYNYRIRKVSTDGMVSTLAGNGQPGFANGSPTVAKFNQPGDVAVDAQGYVYVADLKNQRIRKIAPDGTVSTLAGNGTPAFADGKGGKARFSNPRGVAVDAQGNVYVADMDNNRIRKITPDGTVSTLAGDSTAGYKDGNGTAAQFNHPRCVAVDADGNVIVVDTDNNCIRRISPSGEVTTLAGSTTGGNKDGNGAAAQFNKPKGIALGKSGVIYIADTENNRIRKVLPNGTVTTVVGDGTNKPTGFNQPRGMVLDNQGKILYVVDQDNNRIRKITL